MKVRKTIFIYLMIISGLSYSQKTDKWYNEYINDADSLYKLKNYNAAQGKYFNASKIKKEEYCLKMMDSCRFFINKISDEKYKVKEDKYQQEVLIEEKERKERIKKEDSVKISTLNKEDKEYYRLNAEMAALAWHEQLTQFSNMNINFVTVRIQNYMKKHLKCSLTKDDFNGKNMIISFVESASFNGNPKAIKFNYSVVPNGNDFNVKNCVITGDNTLILKFYIEYWTTKLSVDANKTGVVAETRLLNDIAYLINKDGNYFIKVQSFSNK